MGSPPKRPGSIKAFSKRLGIGRAALLVALRAGRITSAREGPHGWTITDLDAAEREFRENTRPRRPNQPQGPPNGNGSQHPPPGALGAATLRERLARARLIELDVKRKRGLLIPAREAETAEAARIVAARTKMAGIPSRAKQRLPHLTASDLAELAALIQEALEELSHRSEEANAS